MIAALLQQVPPVGIDATPPPTPDLVTPQVPWSYLLPLLVLSVGALVMTRSSLCVAARSCADPPPAAWP